MQHPDGAAPSQIADDLMILRQSMTNIVDSLEKQSLVERSAHPNDRRAYYRPASSQRTVAGADVIPDRKRLYAAYLPAFYQTGAGGLLPPDAKNARSEGIGTESDP